MSDSSPQTEPYIREARSSDSPALSRICLLTGNAGQSAEAQHTFGELIGLVFAEPYVHLPTTFAFVLVDPSKPNPDSDPNGAPTPVGYVLCSHDTRAYEAAALADWSPRVRAKYAYPPEQNEGATDADRRYIHLLHNPSRAPQAAVDFSPAHMHINLLPEYQRKGWGRRLIARVVERLREAHGLERMWLGIDVRNEAAKKFYLRLGFKELEGAPDGTLGLEFKDFQG
ncbi:acyl-CoA N-acyltransferase [Earliella scabrosa]|nr:acyl-CoA N-acyltransferase [Earliella scabrosa]